MGREKDGGAAIVRPRGFTPFPVCVRRKDAENNAPPAVWNGCAWSAVDHASTKAKRLHDTMSHTTLLTSGSPRRPGGPAHQKGHIAQV